MIGLLFQHQSWATGQCALVHSKSNQQVQTQTKTSIELGKYAKLSENSIQSILNHAASCARGAHCEQPMNPPI